MLLDCRSLESRPVRIPDELQIVVVDTGSRRRLAESEYNSRRGDCQRGVAILQSLGAPVRSLRDATLEMLDAAASELGGTVYRRCRHVIEENARVSAAVAALESGDIAALGDLFAASHGSLRDFYEVSSPELDAAVAIATDTPGIVAARMTGAGFGGCTVNLVERGHATALRAAIAERMKLPTSVPPAVYEVEAVDGAGLITV
jgi:galactokinase